MINTSQSFVLEILSVFLKTNFTYTCSPLTPHFCFAINLFCT